MAAPGPSQPGGTQDDKQLGGRIRGLKNRAHHEKHTLVAMEDNKIVTMLQEANEYVTQVTRPRDVAADAELFNFLAENAQEYVHKLKQGGRAHSAADLLRRLKTRFVEDVDAQLAGADDPDAFDWAGLGQGRSVAVLFRSVPATHHMLGPLDAQPRQRRAIQRQAKRKAPVGPADRPEELTSLEDTEKQETDRNMEAMWHLLKDAGGRARLLDLVLNPASFAQTVENLFALSFLVRDGRVALEPDEEEGILVQQRHITKEVKEKSRDEDKTQFIIPLTIEIWEAWVQAVGPGFVPMMNHRKEWRERQQEHQAQRQQQQQQQQQAEQQQQQQEGGEDEEEEGEEEEAARPRQQKRQRQARGKQQQQQQQQRDEEEEEEEQQPEEPPSSGRRKSRSKTPQAPPAKRQQRQQQQRENQQRQQQQPENQQAQQQAQQAQQLPATNGSVEVISIADSESVIDLLDSDDDAPPAPAGLRGATPLQQVQVKQEQPTQGKQVQPSQAGASQRPSQRGPMRGRR